ncbi:HCCA2 protein [Oopsacas minuta]|uniref:HCCA2 protein n=1 Tax=Oopsacas minuta TaxID=111878 RepID=A0AAV7K2A1_9METZ|nr:HCCA2 protein [Oopsacas minuta]
MTESRSVTKLHSNDTLSSVEISLEGKILPPYVDENSLMRNIEGDLYGMCLIFPGTSVNEWLATNTLGFFTLVDLIAASIMEYCTIDMCPEMTAGDTQYYWIDEKNKKQKLPAPNHINLAMSYIQTQLQDRKIFPTKFGHEFSPDFIHVIKRMYRHMLQTIAHLYYHHFQILKELSLHCYLNSLLLHFAYFTKHFELLEIQDLEPLSDLIELLFKIDRNDSAGKKAE